MAQNDLILQRALKRVVSLDEAYNDSYASLVAITRGAADGKSDADGSSRRRSNSNVDIEADPVVAGMPVMMVRTE